MLTEERTGVYHYKLIVNLTDEQVMIESLVTEMFFTGIFRVSIPFETKFAEPEKAGSFQVFRALKIKLITQMYKNAVILCVVSLLALLHRF